MTPPIEITKRSLLLSAILVVLIVAICGTMSLFVVNDPAVKYSHILAKTASIIDHRYIDPVNWKETYLAARKAMTDELDPFSRYISNQELTQFMDDLSGGYFGIGISVVPIDSGLLVYDVREGGPAAATGLLPGDIIIASDTLKLVGMEPEKALGLIRGKENSIFSTKIYRPATKDTLSFEIIRKRIGFLHIPFAGFTSDSAVYIRLLDFGAGASEDFKNALDSTAGKNYGHTKGVIVDLRGNPGGLFFEAREIAKMFLKKGEFIVGTSSRSKWNEESETAKSDGLYSHLPLAVLVDNGSASASEILAGTLKYSGHAVLVGDTTFGKGLVQGFINLPEGDGLRLTISRYYFEGDRYINPFDSAAKVHGVGIPPDIFCSYTEDEPFYQVLEWKLTLLRFAHLHQDEIIATANNPNAKKSWLADLKKYAYANKFEFKSNITKSAELLIKDAETSASKQVAEKIYRTANLLDESLFEKYGDFLWMRLRQIAYERKFSSYKAYKDIVVPQYEPIKIAAEALSQKDSQ